MSFVNSVGLFSQDGGHGGSLETSAVQAIKSEVVDLTQGRDIDVELRSTDKMLHAVCKKITAVLELAITEGSVKPLKKKETFLEESVKQIVKLVRKWIS